MKRLCTLIATATSVAFLAGGLAAGSAAAQQAKGAKDQLIGSWALVSLVVQQRGKKIEPFGPNPIGRMILDANGRFATIVLRPGLPQFVSGNRMQGTPDEHKAVVQGSNAIFGTYSFNEADKSLVFRVEFSTYPNWNGDEQRRIFALAGDQLSYANPTTTVGGGTSQVVWKRVK